MADDSTVHQPLIADETHGDTSSRSLQSTSRAEAAVEQHGRPTIFIWALTVAAGVSGLLFGYEFVLVLHPNQNSPPNVRIVQESFPLPSSQLAQIFPTDHLQHSTKA